MNTNFLREFGPFLQGKGAEKCHHRPTGKLLAVGNVTFVDLDGLARTLRPGEIVDTAQISDRDRERFEAGRYLFPVFATVDGKGEEIAQFPRWNGATGALEGPEEITVP
jgi:hypothetical protein